MTVPLQFRSVGTGGRLKTKVTSSVGINSMPSFVLKSDMFSWSKISSGMFGRNTSSLSSDVGWHLRSETGCIRTRSKYKP